MHCFAVPQERRDALTHCDFLKTINGRDADARQNMLEWARSLDWTGRRQTAEILRDKQQNNTAERPAWCFPTGFLMLQIAGNP